MQMSTNCHVQWHRDVVNTGIIIFSNLAILQSSILQRSIRMRQRIPENEKAGIHYLSMFDPRIVFTKCLSKHLLHPLASSKQASFKNIKHIRYINTIQYQVTYIHTYIQTYKLFVSCAIH